MKVFKWIIVIIVIGAIIWAFRMKKHEQLQPALTQTTPVTSTTTTTPIITKDNMKIQTTTEGTGPAINAGQTAVVQYEGKLTDGSVFDSTAKHGGTPFEFQLGAGMVIKGWDEGVLGMKVGETRVLTIPPELGYGAAGYPPVIPQNATLTFTVTLVGIK